MKLARLIASVLALLAAPLTVPATAEAPGSFNQRILSAHNGERVRLGLAPLQWNPMLAAQAGVWARDLAARGAFEHAKDRLGAGENLWGGTAGAFAPEAMIGAFLAEKQYFRPGTFPDVSTTRRWQDVGHYTQIVWRGTREVGCAMATGKGRDVLVCRYFPAGNVVGQPVY